jgi:hypothetical protein
VAISCQGIKAVYLVSKLDLELFVACRPAMVVLLKTTSEECGS